MIDDRIKELMQSCKTAGAAQLNSGLAHFAPWFVENREELERIADKHTNCKLIGEVVGMVLSLGLEELRARISQMEAKEAEQ